MLSWKPADMADLRLDALRDYLSSLEKHDVEIVRVGGLQKPKKTRLVGKLKGFGYGTPYLIEYKVGKKMRAGVLETQTHQTRPSIRPRRRSLAAAEP